MNKFTTKHCKMALTPLHNFFVYNSEIYPNSRFIPSENEGGIYEVLRVVKGVPLFLNEHLARFYHSAQIAGKIIRFTGDQIESQLQNLIQKNEVYEGNILISCKTNMKAFFIPHNYPSEEMYRKGVMCGLLRAERENPNAKVFQTIVREQANRLIAQKGYFEVLLVDHLERITEGSRSNIFFVKQNVLITPPANEVLLGITRQKTINLAKKLNIHLKEEDVYLKDLKDFQAIAITGTSPKILPVKQVENIFFKADNVVIQKLILGFEELITEYLFLKNSKFS